jgi:hypothetical protein
MSATHNLEAPSSIPASLHGNDGIDSPFLEDDVALGKSHVPGLGAFRIQ